MNRHYMLSLYAVTIGCIAASWIIIMNADSFMDSLVRAEIL
jgi:hypothetical protein